MPQPPETLAPVVLSQQQLKKVLTAGDGDYRQVVAAGHQDARERAKNPELEPFLIRVANGAELFDTEALTSGQCRGPDSLVRVAEAATVMSALIEFSWVPEGEDVTPLERLLERIQRAGVKRFVIVNTAIDVFNERNFRK